MLFIAIYSALIEFSSRKLNENVTYRHYRYVWTVWTEKYLLPGWGEGAKWGQNANYRQFLYGSAIYLVQVE